MTRLAFLPAQALGASAFLASVFVAAGYVTTAAPKWTLVALCIGIGALAASRIPSRYFVAGFLAYVPIEALVLTHVPSHDVAIARYGPELILDVWGALAVFRFGPRIVSRAKPVAVSLAVLVVLWVTGGILNGLSLSTITIGFRSEFRFLLLMPVVAATAQPRRDARLYGRTIVFSAVVEALLGLGEKLSPQLAHLLTPSYSIVLEGTALAQSGQARPGTIAGTFTQYNSLGLYILIALAILLSAGATGLSLRKRTAVGIGVLLTIGLIASGSRESLIAFVVVALFVLRRRRRVPVVTLIAVVALVMAAFGGPLLSELSRGAPEGNQSYTAVSTRWMALFDHRTWSASQYANFRLFYLESSFGTVVRHRPLLGYGTGSVTDRRLYASGTDAVSRTPAGYAAIRWNYVYDGNWSLLLLEVGVLGMLMLGAFLLAIYVVARAESTVEWLSTLTTSLLLVVVVVGFFAAVLQARSMAAALPLFLGLVVAARVSSGKREELAA
jgi:O-antigen ligase/polysaccharide polymerase Wzy-like membrane protein